MMRKWVRKILSKIDFLYIPRYYVSLRISNSQNLTKQSKSKSHYPLKSRRAQEILMNTNKSRVRESTTKIFYDAFQECNDCSDENLMKKIANDLQESVLGLTQVETSKEYREKINFLQMRLQGSHNGPARQALYSSSISCEDFAQLKSENFNENYFQSLLGSQGSNSLNTSVTSDQPPGPAPISGIPKINAAPIINRPPPPPTTQLKRPVVEQIIPQYNPNPIQSEKPQINIDNQTTIQQSSLKQTAERENNHDDHETQSLEKSEISSSTSKLKELMMVQKERHRFIQELQEKEEKGTPQDENIQTGDVPNNEIQFVEDPKRNVPEDNEVLIESPEKPSNQLTGEVEIPLINSNIQTQINEYQQYEENIEANRGGFTGENYQPQEIIENNRYQEIREEEVQQEDYNQHENPIQFQNNEVIDENIEAVNNQQQNLNKNPFEVQESKSHQSHHRLNSFSNPNIFEKQTISVGNSEQLGNISNTINNNNAAFSELNRNENVPFFVSNESNNKFKQENQNTSKQGFQSDSATDSILRLQLVQQGFDYAVEREKVELVRGQLDSYKRENQELKLRIKELITDHKKDLSKQTQVIEEKDKKLIQIEAELENSQQECKMITEHLNKMMIENSKFKEEYNALKIQLTASQSQLVNQIQDLRNQVRNGSSSEMEYVKNVSEELREQNSIFEDTLESLRQTLREKDQIIEQLMKIQTSQTQSVNLIEFPQIPTIDLTPINLNFKPINTFEVTNKPTIQKPLEEKQSENVPKPTNNNNINNNNSNSNNNSKPKTTNHSTGSINDVAKKTIPNRDADSGSTAVRTQQVNSKNQQNTAPQQSGGPSTLNTSSSNKSVNIDDSSNRIQETVEDTHHQIAQNSFVEEGSVKGHTQLQSDSQRPSIAESESKNFQMLNESHDYEPLKQQPEPESQQSQYTEPPQAFVHPQLLTKRAANNAAQSKTTPARQVFNASNAFGLESSFNKNDDARSEKSEQSERSEFSQSSSNQFLTATLAEANDGEDFFQKFNQVEVKNSNSQQNKISNESVPNSVTQTEKATPVQTLERPPSTASIHSNISSATNENESSFTQKGSSSAIYSSNNSNNISGAGSNPVKPNSTVTTRTRVQISGNKFD